MVSSPTLKAWQPSIAVPAHRVCESEGPSEEEVRAQLERIVSSSDFMASARNRRFLEHVVLQTLLGRKPKGYEIGTIAFGRSSSFNPTTDPIVRIEASKLRRDLERYYLTTGKSDRVRISLPKGGYRAEFSYVEAPSTGADRSRGATVLLRAALLGWSGQSSEAANAWRALLQVCPDFSLNAGSHEMLNAVCGGDPSVRALIVEGLRRASVLRNAVISHNGHGIGPTA